MTGIALTDIDTAVAQRAAVKISDRSGHAAGTTGILMGYHAGYDNVKVGFVDESGEYTGDFTTVARASVDLVVTPDVPDVTRTLKRKSDHTARTVTLAVTGMADFPSDDQEDRWIRASEAVLAYGWNGWRFVLSHVKVSGRYVLGGGRVGARKYTRTWQVLDVYDGGAPRFYVEEGIPAWLDGIAGSYADPDNPTI